MSSLDLAAVRAILAGDHRQLEALRAKALVSASSCCPVCQSADTTTNCRGDYSQCLECGADWDHAEVHQ